MNLSNDWVTKCASKKSLQTMYVETYVAFHESQKAPSMADSPVQNVDLATPSDHQVW